MTVRELINKLLEQDLNSKVTVEDREDYLNPTDIDEDTLRPLIFEGD